MGVMPEASATRLREIGEWLEVNGESICGAMDRLYWKMPPWGHVMRKPGTLCHHVFGRPKGGRFVAERLVAQPKRAYLLDGSGGELGVKLNGDNLLVEDLPTTAPDDIDRGIVVEVEGEAHVGREMATPGADGSLAAKAVDAVPRDRGKWQVHAIGGRCSDEAWLGWGALSVDASAIMAPRLPTTRPGPSPAERHGLTDSRVAMCRQRVPDTLS